MEISLLGSVLGRNAERDASGWPQIAFYNGIVVRQGVMCLQDHQDLSERVRGREVEQINRYEIAVPFRQYSGCAQDSASELESAFQRETAERGLQSGGGNVPGAIGKRLVALRQIFNRADEGIVPFEAQRIQRGGQARFDAGGSASGDVPETDHAADVRPGLDEILIAAPECRGVEVRPGSRTVIQGDFGGDAFFGHQAGIGNDGNRGEGGVGVDFGD